MLSQKEFELHLVGALRKDADSERAIYEGFVAYVFSIVLKYVSDRDDAADVTQETMIHAFEKLKNYDPNKGQFKSWLAKIAINRSLKWMGKMKNVISLESTGKFIELIHSTDSKERLGDQLKPHLNDSEKELFELYFELNFSHAEIAKALGISISNSRVKIHRIVNYLKSLPS
jgi:RNA polymerase sigma-70 factor (ECF subfamily)